MDEEVVIERLTSLADPRSTAGMKRVGISSETALGVRVPHLRALAREIGKRSRFLNREAIGLAEEIAAIGTPAARWIAADAIRELTSDAVRARLKR